MKNFKLLVIGLAGLSIMVAVGCAKKPDRTNPLDPLSADFDSSSFGIKGLVLDESTNQPVAKVRVSLAANGTTYSAATDEAGNFLFNSTEIFPGSYQLNFNRSCYQSTVKDIVKTRLVCDAQTIRTRPNIVINETFEDGSIVDLSPVMWYNSGLIGTDVINPVSGFGRTDTWALKSVCPDGFGTSFIKCYTPNPSANKKARLSFWVKISSTPTAPTASSFIYVVMPQTYVNPNVIIAGAGIFIDSGLIAYPVFFSNSNKSTPYQGTQSLPFDQWINMVVEHNYSGEDANDPTNGNTIYINGAQVLRNADYSVGDSAKVETIFIYGKGTTNFYIDDVVLQQ